MKVIELVKTIHGELPYSGYPCTLIRFKDCNLSCGYCDADLTKPVTDMTVDDIVFACEINDLPHILVTGGEPLLEPEIYQLLHELDERGFTVVVETNGSLPISRDSFESVTFNMDVKLDQPTAKEQGILNLPNLSTGDCLKFIYSTDEDWEAMGKILIKLPSVYEALIVFSPAAGQPARVDDFLTLCQLFPHLNLRMQTQLHKVLNVA